MLDKTQEIILNALSHYPILTSSMLLTQTGTTGIVLSDSLSSLMKSGEVSMVYQRVRSRSVASFYLTKNQKLLDSFITKE